MINLILFGSFFVMLLLNIPIAVSLGMSSIFALLFSSSPLTVVPTNVYSGMAKFLLLAIPFFVLSGNIMAKAGISSRLVAFADDCVGHRRGGIMLIIGAATLFSYVCTVFGIAQAAQALLLEISGNKYIFLLIVNVIFLIAGCFVDANSAMYIFIPIMYPVATQLGIDPVHFGVIATVNLAIGQVTPPVGVNLFVAIGVSEKLQGLRDKTKVTIVSMSKAVWPQIVACIIALLLITYVPWFSTVLLFGK